MATQKRACLSIFAPFLTPHLAVDTGGAREIWEKQ